MLSVLLAAHGIAHLPGFLVPWRLMTSPDLPYKTTLLAGRIDVGDVGIRIVGLAWLAVSLLMVMIAVGVAFQVRRADALVLVPVVASLVLCGLELPHARIGFALNIVMLLLLAVHPTMGAGVMRWNQATDDERGRLTSTSLGPVGRYEPADVGGAPCTAGDSASVVCLPAPVMAFFARSLTPGQPLVRATTIIQTGQFRMSEEPDSWRPFTATQSFTVQPPGFVWDARIAAFPLMPVFVRDSYISGQGGMVGSVLGLFTVVDAAPSAELDAGALQRYLGESIWFPSALLPASGMTWTPVDDRRAVATLVDDGTSVSLEFTFNDDGDVVRVFASGRLREIDGRYVPTPWVVECAEHGDLNGMRVPRYCEVSWLLPDGKFTYWKGRVMLGA